MTYECLCLASRSFTLRAIGSYRYLKATRIRKRYFLTHRSSGSGGACVYDFVICKNLVFKNSANEYGWRLGAHSLYAKIFK